MRDIMLDLETLSLDNNAVIVSIGAVQFDLHTGEIGKTFHRSLNILEQAINKGHIDRNTLSWWSIQSEEAKVRLVSLAQSPVKQVLTDFNTWIKEHTTDIKNTRLWGNGVSADNVWIRNLYKRHNVEFVLPYWCDTDVRTLVQLEDYDKVKSTIGEFTGTKHDAIDDCKYQIKLCNTAYKLLKDTL